MAQFDYRMEQRADTSANATSNDPTLAVGEIFYETDTKKFMIGTGGAYSAIANKDKFHTPNQLLSAEFSTSAPSDKHVLIYDGVTDDRYENRQLATTDLSDESGIALLGGRSGGQTINGGTGSGDDLTLISTTNATKGSILFGTDCAWDQVNSEFGIGIQSGMLAKTHIKTGSSGLVALGADVDDLLVEGSGNTGLAIVGGTSSVCTLAFGDSGDPDVGRVEYNNADNSMAFYTSATKQFEIDSNGFRKGTVTQGITASVTQTQGQGALTSEINEVSTVANTNDTVTLTSAAAGIHQIIFNNGANTLKIFPASGDNLGAGVDTSTTLPAGSNVHYIAYDSTNWEAV